MIFTEARRVLGLHATAELKENDIRIAFARCVRLAHPDVGGGKSGETENMARYTTAKDTLLRLVGEQDLNDGTCMACKGTGSVRGTLFNVVCKSCKGSGKDANLSRR